MWGLSSLTDDITLSVDYPLFTINFKADVADVSSNGSYEMALLGTFLTGAGAYDIELTNLSITLDLKLSVDFTSGRFNFSDVELDVAFDGLHSFLENLMKNGVEFDWEDPAQQDLFTSFIRLAASTLTDTVNDDLLNSLFEVGTNGFI